MKSFLYNHIVEIVAAVLGAVVFIWFYGIDVINPLNTDFLYIGGDLSQHYIGWELYRDDYIHQIIGLTNRAAYPYVTSVIFTDSIPLFAVIFKVISKIFGIRREFQYFGLWGLLCFVLQGFFAAKLVKPRVKIEGIVGIITSILISLLFVFCPFFIRRMFWHTSLASHFIILIALYLLDNSEKYSNTRFCIYWIMVSVLVASVHIYLLAMCGVIMFAASLYRLMIHSSNRITIIRRIVYFVAPLFFFIFFGAYTIFVLGGFTSGMDSGAPGIGYYSFNLNGLFNADDGYSILLPFLGYYEYGQYEGNAYLGAGVLLLCFVGLISLVVYIIERLIDRINVGGVTDLSGLPAEGLSSILPETSSEPSSEPSSEALSDTSPEMTIAMSSETSKKMEAVPVAGKGKYRLIAYGVLTIILLALATSNVVTFGEKLLFEFELPGIISKIYDPFRSSGRLIWPVAYVIIIGAVDGVFLSYVNQKGKRQDTQNTDSHKGYFDIVKWILFVIVVVSVSLQIYDMSGKITSLRNDFQNEKCYVNPVYGNDGVLDGILKGEYGNEKPEHIVFLNKDSLSQELLYAFADAAIREDMTINDFYFARNFHNDAPDIAWGYALEQRTDCVFIYLEEELEQFKDLPLDLYIYNGIVYGIAK